jgi:hypothetical protein
MIQSDLRQMVNPQRLAEMTSLTRFHRVNNKNAICARAFTKD